MDLHYRITSMQSQYTVQRKSFHIHTTNDYLHSQLMDCTYFEMSITYCFSPLIYSNMWMGVRSCVALCGVALQSAAQFTAWTLSWAHAVCMFVCVMLHEGERNGGRWWAAVWVKARFGMCRPRYLFGRQSTGLCLWCDNTGPTHKTGLVS